MIVEDWMIIIKTFKSPFFNLFQNKQIHFVLRRFLFRVYITFCADEQRILLYVTHSLQVIRMAGLVTLYISDYTYTIYYSSRVIKIFRRILKYLMRYSSGLRYLIRSYSIVNYIYKSVGINFSASATWWSGQNVWSASQRSGGHRDAWATVHHIFPSKSNHLLHRKFSKILTDVWRN